MSDLDNPDIETRGDEEIPLLDEDDYHETGEYTDPAVSPVTLANGVEFFIREAEKAKTSRPHASSQFFCIGAAFAEFANAAPENVVELLERSLNGPEANPWALQLVRRSFMRLRNFEGALTLCHRELKVGGESKHRHAVATEATALLWLHSGRMKRASEMAETALSLGQDVGTLYTAIALRLLQGQFEEAAQGYEALSDMLSTANDRANAAFSAATLYDLKLRSEKAAERAYRKAIEANGYHLPALYGLSSLYQSTGEWIRLAKLTENIAQLAASQETKSRLYLYCGALHMDHSGDLEAAARALNSAAAAAPRSVAPIQRLAYVHESTGRTDELVAALRRLHGLTIDSRGRAAMLSRIGWLLQTRAQDNGSAIAAFCEAIESDADYLPALQALGSLYAQVGDFAKLVEIYQPEAEGGGSPLARAMRHFQMAELFQEKLAQNDQAIASYRRALEIFPGFILAFWGLERLLRQLKRFDDLALLLANQAETSTDKKTRNFLLLELAKIKADQLGQIPQAIEILQSSGDLGESRTAPLLMLDYHRRQGDFVRLVEGLLVEARQTQDKSEKEGRLLQAAHILQSNLNEPDRALQIYRSLLEQNPLCIAAFRAAGSIYHRLARWESLITLYHQELKVNPGGVSPAVIHSRIGRIYDEQLGRVSDAIDSYSVALRSDPSYEPALASLERLVRTNKRWRELVNVLCRYAEARLDPATAADALCRAAEISENHLQELDRAIELYDEALRRDPAALNPRYGLLRVRRKQGRFGEAINVLRALHLVAEESDRAQLKLELARLCEFRTPEGLDLDLYDQAAPNQAVETSLRLELLRGRWLKAASDLPVFLQNKGERTDDSQLSAAMLLECAYRVEFSKDDADTQLEAAHVALLKTPNDERVGWAYERALLRSHRWQDLGQHWQNESTRRTDVGLSEALGLYAAISFFRGDYLEEADESLSELLKSDGDQLGALWLQGQVARLRKAWRRFAQIQDRIASVVRDEVNQREAAFEASRIWQDQLHDSGRALASLAPILLDSPGDPEAFSRAADLLRQREEYADLSRLYRHRIRVCDEEQVKVELLRDHALILQTKLRDPDRAISELNELLSLRSDDYAALETLAHLLVEQKRWADAAETFGCMVEAATDDDTSQSARLRQAEVLLRQLRDPAAARRVLENVPADRQGDRQTQRLLVDVYVKNGQWTKARQLLDAMSDVEDMAEQVWTATQLADIARIGLRNEELRRQYEYRAIEKAGGDILGKLVEQYRQRQEQGRFVDIGEEILRNRESDPPVDLAMALASLLLHDMAAPERAMAQLAPVLAKESGNIAAQELFALGLEKKGNREKARDRYRRILEQEPSSALSYHGLARVLREEAPASAAAAAGIATLLGKESDRLETHLPAPTTAPPGMIGLDGLSFPKSLRPLVNTLEAIAPQLGFHFPVAEVAPVPNDAAINGVCLSLARTLAVKDIRLFSGSGPNIEIGIGRPLRLIVPSAYLSQVDSPNIRFWLGHALAMGASAGSLLERCSDQELQIIIEALLTAKPYDADTQQLRKALLKKIPRKVRKSLELLEIPQTQSEDWRRLRFLMRKRAHRIGLLLCGAAEVAIKEVAKREDVDIFAANGSPLLPSLMRFAVSNDYPVLHAQLWDPTIPQIA
jgi:tetratricopeptide (TPR) repeat protein